MTEQASFDNDMPIVRYEMVFPKQRLLPDLTKFDAVNAGSVDMPDQANTGIAEQLSEHIDWEPHVDEADKIDYIVAVSSGVVTGLIDILFTGEFSLDRASEWGKDKIEQIVIKVAQAEGYKSSDLNEAIKNLEKKHPLAADGNINDLVVASSIKLTTSGLRPSW